MANFEDSIAHKAHGLVHGHRAKDYGHPRFDFRIIAKVWSGLLADKFKPGEEIDEYRVAVLMTGLKLARLVKSPEHNDSRVDTIGYMLTMERLDEPAIKIEEDEPVTPGNSHPCGSLCPEEEGTPCCDPDWYKNKGFPPGTFTDLSNCDCLAGACTCRKISFDVTGQPADALKFTQINLWFEPGETKYVNGRGIVNTDKDCGKIICVPLDGNNGPITISPHPPATVKEVHDPRSEIEKAQFEDNVERVKRIHNHEHQAPCIPGCPVWEIENKHRPQFGFTGETVEFKRPDTRPGGGL